MKSSKEDPIQHIRWLDCDAPANEALCLGATENISSTTDMDKGRAQRIRELAYRLVERRGGVPRRPFADGPEARELETDRAPRSTPRA